MYAVAVRDQMMVAHSLKGEVFGRAQNLHGATYVVEAEFMREDLDEYNTVIDMGLASKIVKDVISNLDYENLDDLDEFRSETTTTEYLARHVHNEIALRARRHFVGGLRVTLRESPQAWASYEGDVE